MEKILVKRSLVFLVEVGSDPDTGKPIFKRFMYSGVNEEATIDGIHQTATALASLTNGILADVTVVDTNQIF
jgi:hypothetical protein